MKDNIFSPVVLEPADTSETNNAPLVVLIMAVPIMPFSDNDDVKGSGLNQ